MRGHEKGQDAFRYSLILSVAEEANLLDCM